MFFSHGFGAWNKVEPNVGEGIFSAERIGILKNFKIKSHENGKAILGESSEEPKSGSGTL